MITAGQFKKGVVITYEGATWTVEDYHIQKTAQRKPVLQTKLRNMKTGHIVERAFDESDRFETPNVQSRTHQFLYHDREGYVFMDKDTFDQLTVPAAVVGNGKWVLRENEEYVIRLLEGQPVQVVLPPTFVDKVVETAEPTSVGAGSNVMKDAKLACGLVIKVPMFIRVGEHLKIGTEDHAYHGKESGKK